MKTLIVQTMIAVAFCGIVCADQCPQTDREAQLMAARQQQRPESERQILRQLDVPITLNIDKSCTLEQALNMVCAQIDIVPTIDEAAFREANIWADKTVALPWTYGGIRAKSVLNVILDQGDLVYTVNGGTFSITTKSKEKERAQEVKFPQLHYVGDIIPVTPTATGIGVGGLKLGNLMELIQTVVEPDSWYMTGGDACIDFHFAMQSLAVRQTEEAHAQIADMLNQVRNLNSEEQILRRLEQPIVVDKKYSLSLEEAPQLLNRLTDNVGFSYFLDAQALRDADIPLNVLVEVPQTNETSMKDVLNTILDQHGLTYVVKNEMLVITSKIKARGAQLAQMHYVGDIVSNFGNSDSSNPNPEVSELIDTITSVIDPDSWTDGGACIATHPATQSLAIRHFEDVHVQIEDMLNQMRKVNDEQQASSLLPTERNDNRPISVRERMRVRTVASPISLRQNRIVR